MPSAASRDRGHRGRRRSWVRAIAAVGARPGLWPDAVRVAARTVPRRWWRRRPYLPVPDRAYLRFRLETQYGEAGAPRPADLVTYLSWCRAERRERAAGRAGPHR